jgi:outer membrane biosynthesis protein TonB
MNKIQEKAFEKKKNIQALTYALIISGLLFISFIFVSWTTPEPELPIKEDLVEINLDNIDLGNETNGFGDIQPLVKGDFAAVDGGAPSPKETATENIKAPVEEAADPETDDNNNDDAPEVPKPVVRPKNPSRDIKPATPPTTPVTNPTPRPSPAPKPKATFGGYSKPGATGSGGNNADQDRFGSQGNGTGVGDNGSPYGTPGGTGTRVTAARPTNLGEIQRLAEQSGTNYRGSVKLVLRIDDDGNVTSIVSNSPSPASREAKAKANEIGYKMKFSKGADGRSVTYTLVFDY